METFGSNKIDRNSKIWGLNWSLEILYSVTFTGWLTWTNSERWITYIFLSGGKFFITCTYSIIFTLSFSKNMRDFFRASPFKGLFSIIFIIKFIFKKHFFLTFTYLFSDASEYEISTKSVSKRTSTTSTFIDKVPFWLWPLLLVLYTYISLRYFITLPLVYQQ